MLNDRHLDENNWNLDYKYFDILNMIWLRIDYFILVNTLYEIHSYIIQPVPF